MVALQAGQLDAVFHALSDRTRRGMLKRLAGGEGTIGELAGPLAMSFQAASKHVKVLEGAGLVKRRVEGRTHVCRLVPSMLAGADEWLKQYEQFWNERFDALDALLKAEDRGMTAAPAKRRHPAAGKDPRHGRRKA